MLSYLKTQYNVTDYSEHGPLENIEAIFIIYRSLDIFETSVNEFNDTHKELIYFDNNVYEVTLKASYEREKVYGTGDIIYRRDMDEPLEISIMLIETPPEKIDQTYNLSLSMNQDQKRAFEQFIKRHDIKIL